MTKIKNYLNKNFIEDIKLSVTPAIFFTMVLSLLINPLLLQNIQVESFNRVLGIATVHGIDPTRRVSNLLLFNTLYLPLCFLVSFVFIKIVTNFEKLKQNTALQGYLKSISLAGIGMLAFTFISKYAYNTIEPINLNSYISNLESMGLYTIIVISIIIFLTLFSTNMLNAENYDNFKWSIVVSFAVSLIFNFLTQTNTALAHKLIFKYRFIFIFFIIGIMILYFIRYIDTLKIEKIKQASIPLFFTILFAGLALELTNILNQRNIFIVNRLFFAKFIALAVVSMCLIIYFENKKLSLKWEKISYVGLILSTTYFTIIPPLTRVALTDLFEYSNAGMLVYDLFNYGKVPLLESFDGHMLQHSLDNILYGILNGATATLDPIFFYYNSFQLLITVFTFYLLCKSFKAEFALFVTIFVPQLVFVKSSTALDSGLIPVISYINFFVIVLIAFVYALNKKTTFSWVLYFLSLAAAAFYELPPAVAIAGGTLTVIFAIILSDILKQKKFTQLAKNFLKAAAIVFGFFGALVFIVAYIRGVNVFSRAFEFIGLINSNNNWAMNSIGDQNSMIFSLMYSVIPAICLFLLACAIVKYISLKKQTQNLKVENNFTIDKKHIRQLNALLIVIASLIALYFNFSRAFGRHSLVNGQYGIKSILTHTFIAFIFLGAAFIPKYKKEFLILFFIITPIFSSALMTNVTPTAKPLFENFNLSFNNSRNYYQGANEKSQRVDYSQIYTMYGSVITMLNTVIDESETFIDMTGNTTLYALTNKEKPVYVNQSPLHLSGEYTQEQFIKQIENFDGECNYVLFGGNLQALDGVDNSVRYYLVYEYIIENFTPLCYEDETNYSLWVRNEKSDETLERLRVAGLLVDENDSANYDIDNDLSDTESEIIEDETQAEKLAYKYLTREFYNHTYYIKNLPYVWGNFDKYEAYDNEVIKSITYADNLIPESMQEKSNYILLEISAETDCPANLYLKDTEDNILATFNFEITGGTNKYLIRVSSDMYWRTQDLQLDLYLASENATIINFALLKGD